MRDEIVYSAVNDHRIKADLINSPIWRMCYKKEEVTEEIKKKHQRLYAYHIKFDGLIPVQHTKTEKVA